MAMTGLTRVAEHIPATEVTVARTWDAVSLTSLGYIEENITGKQPLRTLAGIHLDTIQNKTNMMYIAMTFEEFTAWTWASRGYINFFNRGYSAVHMQIHMNKTWVQTQDELSKHRGFQVHRQQWPARDLHEVQLEYRVHLVLQRLRES